ncbi:MAG TPA: hypothetical protein VI815_01500 [Candidatus Nanoarchaeia archaeon]|nr:hypothetical protein [Candidatus Nanoarchaeia archaeon]
MESGEIDIPLTKEEEEEKIDFLKKRKFSDFRIHPYYNRDSYIKHIVELDIIKDIYPQFDKIIGVFKRPANKGYKYSFIYKIEDVKSLVLCFYLDETPPKFFNAYFDYTKQDKKLRKKVEKWMKRESKGQ